MNNDSKVNKKISVFVFEISGKGGICHYTYNLCNALYDQNIDISLVSSINYELSSLNKKFSYHPVFNRFKTNPFKVLRFFNFLKKNKPLIIHFQLSQQPLIILILTLICKIFFKIKIIITAHNILSHEERFYTKILFSSIYRLADANIVHAHSNKVEMIDKLTIPSNKISVIPHGNYMFFNQFNQNDENNFQEKFTSPIILFFGYIRKYKGLIYLIRSMPEILKSIPSVKLIIAGYPVESFNEYLKEIDKLRLSNNIILDLNYISFEKVRYYFQISNVVVLPYLKIYQSGILQLAYGFGKPVVVTSTGGLVEAVKNGYSGYIIPPKDTSAMAKSIIKIISDKENSNKMGANALYLAKTEFSWQSVAQKTSNLYHNIL